MTVEIGANFQEPFYLKKRQSTEDSSEEERLNNIHRTEEYTENVSPIPTGIELMVAVRPVMQQPFNSSKINISTPNKKTIEQSILIAKNIVSPIKRPLISGLAAEAPLSKKTPCPESAINPLLGSPSYRQLSQSAGSSSQLQSAIRRAQTNLSQSCFADLRSNRGDDIDNDLTCLNWLQEGNLLNSLTSDRKSEEEEANEGSEKENETSDKRLKEHSDLRLNLSDPLNAISEVDKSLRKPAYSFSTLIFMAIENAKDKRLPVKEIYQWIQDNFPYFQKAPIGWKNSVRHNLSLNKSFKKVDKEKCVGKGSLWTIDHEARAGLVQQLRKTATYHSYPYSRLLYPNRYYTKERVLCKRDSTGRFVPNHDDAEFDVAATMCSLSSPAALYRSQSGSSKSSPEEQKSSVELLKIWRTYIEPKDNDDGDDDVDGEKENENQDTKNQLGSNSPKKSLTKSSKPKYTIDDFLDEVHNKLSFNGKRNNSTKARGGSLNTSLDEDYEFYNSEEDSSDEDDEMNQNMRKLVEKERDDDLGDSGYSEEGTLKSSTMLDHSYSKSIQSLCKPQSRRESKGVAALLSLANAASKELESLCRDSPEEDVTLNSPNTRSKCNSNVNKHINLIKNKSSIEGVVNT